MRLFKYLSSKSPKELYDIFKVVQSLKPYAKSKYGSNYEDALDASYEHIIKNYDSDKGELRNYAIKVVGTIWLNSNKKEVANEEKTKISLDTKTAQDFVNSPTEEKMEENLKSDNINSCINDMVEFFVKDFKFFATTNSKYKKMDYSELRDKYTSESILSAMRYLNKTYSEEIGKFISYSKTSSIRNFDENRYKKSIDTSLEYKGILNDIVLLKRKQGSHIKKVYKVSLKDTISKILELFYSDTNYGMIVVANIPVYLTLSGKIVDNIDDLKYSLEKELVGSLLSRTSLKVLRYERGNEILLSSTKDTQCDVVLPLFGKNVSINFERVVVKEV
ncbi:hypothetical protein ACEE21_15320 [Clostridium baratii]